MIKFIREFQLFILVFLVVISSFILCLRNDRDKTVPYTFLSGAVFSLVLLCKYPPDYDWIEPNVKNKTGEEKVKELYNKNN